MTRSNEDPDTTDAAHDPLLRRYREASALDDERPAPGLREAVLAQARAQATKDTHPLTSSQRPTAAANDRTWTRRALGTLAVLGLVGLLMLQFDQGTPEERDIAFGSPPSPTEPSAIRSQEPAGPPPAPASVEPKPVPQTPAAEIRNEAPQAPPTPTTRQEPESAIDRPPATEPATPQPMQAPVPQVDRRGAEADVHGLPSESTARSRAAAPPPAIDTPAPAASAESSRPALQMAPELLRVPALLRAAQVGDLASAREAIARADDLNAADVNGRTALMTAAARGDEALVRLLLDAGANTALRDQNGLSAADHARQAGHDSVVDLL